MLGTDRHANESTVSSSSDQPLRSQRPKKLITNLYQNGKIPKSTCWAWTGIQKVSTVILSFDLLFWGQWSKKVNSLNFFFLTTFQFFKTVGHLHVLTKEHSFPSFFVFVFVFVFIFRLFGTDTGINFGTYMAYAFPGMVICLLLTWGWLQLFFIDRW